MNPATWASVDEYYNATLVREDGMLRRAQQACSEAGLPAISVSAAQGKLLNLIAKMIGAKRILEVGTLGGYSTIWLAHALPPEGKLITLEFDPKHAKVARANIARAGLDRIVDLRLGKALDTLPVIESERGDPFDLFFIDADKQSNADYFQWALKLSRKGSVIIVDNVVRSGAVVDATSKDPGVLGVRRLNDMIANEKRVSATAIQTVGAKGYDGFTIAVVV